MKYDYERIALWSIVIILIVAVFFQQRRSGFSLQPGNETSSISLMDMMEYRNIPEHIRTSYKQMLTSTTFDVSSNGNQYQMKLGEIMNNAFKTPLPPNVPPPNVPPPNVPPPNVPPPPPTLAGVPPYLTGCTNAIVFDKCTSNPNCPSGMTLRMIGNLKFCICPEKMPVMNAPMTPNGIPVCSASCPPYMTKRLRLNVTGQLMCISQCPPQPPPGITCI
jgi:hypothetical protein